MRQKKPWAVRARAAVEEINAETITRPAEITLTARKAVQAAEPAKTISSGAG